MIKYMVYLDKDKKVSVVLDTMSEAFDLVDARTRADLYALGTTASECCMAPLTIKLGGTICSRCRVVVS